MDQDAPRLSWRDIVPYLLARGPDVVNLSSGNPVVQVEVVEALRASYARVIGRPDLARVVYRYEDPQGDVSLRKTLAATYRARFGFSVSADNVIITPGSQAAFFYVSEVARQEGKRVYFPAGPEYPGYRTHHDTLYRMHRPRISKIGPHEFRYDFTAAADEIPADTLFAMVSSPGNPTGKVLTGADIERLQAACAERGAHLVVDGAYAPPVPNIMLGDIHFPWDERTLFITSLSKAGLAGERLGALMAPIPIVEKLLAVHDRLAIMAPRLVQFVADDMLASGRYQDLAERVIRPAYVERHAVARRAVRASLPDELPYYVFDAGGGPFMWIWFDDLPGTTDGLFLELAKQRVLVVPSSIFYVPELLDVPHTRQCLRIGLVEEPAMIERGIAAVSRAVNGLYGL